MIPPEIDMADLEGQLAADGIAFGAENPVNGPVEAAMRDALDAASSAGQGHTGLVVLEHTPAHVPDLRDVAQDLLLAGDFDTVIVRTPQVALAVSDTLDRASIDAGQRAMVAESDYPQGVIAFVEAADSFHVPWIPLALAAAIVFGVVIGATVWAVRRRM